MKRKNKIGILTSISMLLSKIVYANRRIVDVVEPEYGVYTPTPKLYGVVSTSSDFSSIANTNTLVIIGKIAIIPVVLLVGIFTIVKLTGRKKKNTKEEKANEEKK